MTTDKQPRPDTPLLTALTAMRPSQWTKNVVVLAAFFFAFWDQSRVEPLVWQDIFIVIPAALLFCLASSGIYILNDIRDVKSDRNHPVKCHRPIASGAMSIPRGYYLSILLLALATAGACLLSKPFAVTLSAYIVMQILYTFFLKRIALLDVMVIAFGFVIRAIAGAVVLDVSISPWLLLCTFLLALFLALCKRRQEKLLHIEGKSDMHRDSLQDYDARLLDQLVSATAGATILSYSIYTLWPETVEKFGTHALGLTIPFVIFGIFRYLDLTYRHGRGERPERILLTDIPTLANLALYGITLLIIFLLHR